VDSNVLAVGSSDRGSDRATWKEEALRDAFAKVNTMSVEWA
jgi:hypothetical protein